MICHQAQDAVRKNLGGRLRILGRLNGLPLKKLTVHIGHSDGADRWPKIKCENRPAFVQL